MKELLVMLGKWGDAFGGVSASLKRIADSLEGCHYELVALRKLAEKT